MKSLSDYLLGVRKEQSIKIRLACELNDQDLEKIERQLKKYGLVRMSLPKKTIFQKTALGFAEPVNCEVIIIEATLDMPFVPEILRIELARVLKIFESKIVVEYIADEPMEEKYRTTTKIVDTYVGQQGQTEDVELKFDHKDYYGSEYNEDMIKTLSDARKEIKKQFIEGNE